ncbi:hypothetical protein QTG54_007608 [Skeletonema marinoi]|uniref:Uncharacterized protein n=1 Tax=Skeletonema marinoi TaxID=267567 RepID=A0AAD9DDQ8_9STRA|nr:hypothetical protein QTG54_007608 [Skeletonema marinoi]
MPLEKRRSERSFGGSFSSLSLSGFFGLEDEIDEDPLSEFQQQSLSVFESEHMWAHFKAHLAEKNIHTTAGVKAMLPQFVNNRVLDGSVQSERHNEGSSVGTGPGRQEGLGRNARARSVYPSAMRRRQESFGRNTEIYGRSRSHSGSLSQSINSAHDINSYYEAIRGDTENVISLYDSEIESDVNLLTSVSRRLSRMTTDRVASNRFSSTPTGRDRSNSVFSTVSARRESSIFSSVSASNDPRSSCNLGMSNVQEPLRPMAESSGSGSSRPKFRRPSICTDEDIPTYELQLPEGDGSNPRRPSESSMHSKYSREVVGLAEEALLHAAGELESLDEINFTQSASVYKVDKPSFSYQPQRAKVDRKDNLQVRDDPSVDEDNNTETNDSVAHKIDVVHKDDQTEVPSFNSSDTLLVEWGEGDSISEDEDCYDDGTLSVDSERAVMGGDLFCNSHEEENSSNTTAVERKETPKSRRGVLMAVLATLSLEKNIR